MIVSNDEERNGSSMDKEEVTSPPEHLIEQAAKGSRTIKGGSISPKKRLIASSILSLMCFSTTFSSSAYASSALTIERYFNTTQDVVLLGIALFVLGFALGPLFFGPLSFVIGKRPVYLITFLSFTAFSFGAAESRNIETLIVLRFLAGACGSSALNNVPASLTDMLELNQLNSFMMFYALGSTAGPGLAPVIMGYVDRYAGWRWNLRVQAILIACSTVACIIFVPETADLQDQQTSKNKERKIDQIYQSFQLFSKAMKKSLARPFAWLFFEPVVTVICLYISLLYGVLYATFEAVPYVFIGIRHWTTQSTGLFFLSLFIGFLVGGILIVILQGRYYKSLEMSNTPITAETRFRQALWGAFLPPIGLFIFAWTSPFPNIHWIAPAIGMFLFSAGMLIIFTSLLPYISLYAGKEAPMAMAAATFTRCAFGCFFPLVTTRMLNKMTTQGACSFLAGVALLLVPVPWFLNAKGAYLRQKH